MRICGALILLTALALPAWADEKGDKGEKDKKVEKSPPEGWKEVSGGYKKLAYSVWMPAGVKVDDKETSIVGDYGQVRVFRTVCERKDGMLFAAGQINLPPKLTKESPKVRQNYFRDSFLKEFEGKLSKEKDVKLGTMAGKEYTAATPNGLARMRLYGTGVQMFRVLVVGTKEQAASKDADVFFDSFKRTPERLQTKDGTKKTDKSGKDK
jgi:hypothetical protein